MYQHRTWRWMQCGRRERCHLTSSPTLQCINWSNVSWWVVFAWPDSDMQRPRTSWLENPIPNSQSPRSVTGRRTISMGGRCATSLGGGTTTCWMLRSGRKSTGSNSASSTVLNTSLSVICSIRLNSTKHAIISPSHPIVWTSKCRCCQMPGSPSPCTTPAAELPRTSTSSRISWIRTSLMASSRSPTRPGWRTTPAWTPPCVPRQRAT